MFWPIDIESRWNMNRLHQDAKPNAPGMSWNFCYILIEFVVKLRYSLWWHNWSGCSITTHSLPWNSQPQWQILPLLPRVSSLWIIYVFNINSISFFRNITPEKSTSIAYRIGLLLKNKFNSLAFIFLTTTFITTNYYMSNILLFLRIQNDSGTFNKIFKFASQVHLFKLQTTTICIHRDTVPKFSNPAT